MENSTATASLAGSPSSSSSSLVVAETAEHVCLTSANGAEGKGMVVEGNDCARAAPPEGEQQPPPPQQPLPFSEDASAAADTRIVAPAPTPETTTAAKNDALSEEVVDVAAAAAEVKAEEFSMDVEVKQEPQSSSSLWPTTTTTTTTEQVHQPAAQQTGPTAELQAKTEEEQEEEDVYDSDEALSEEEEEEEEGFELEEEDVMEGGETEIPRTKNEITSLPPVERVPPVPAHAQIKPLGLISSLVEGFAVVEAAKGSPALDIDSVLCLENREPLGRVFEVFGQVESPYYSVRYDGRGASGGENGEGERVSVERGTRVYYVEEQSSYVIPAAIYTKGTDASGEHDEELPEDEIEFSDDEKEAAAKQARKRRGRKQRTRGGKGEGFQNRRGGGGGQRRGPPSQQQQQQHHATTAPPHNSFMPHKQQTPSSVSAEAGVGEVYTPLARPPHLLDHVLQQQIPTASHSFSSASSSSFHTNTPYPPIYPHPPSHPYHHQTSPQQHQHYHYQQQQQQHQYSHAPPPAFPPPFSFPASGWQPLRMPPAAAPHSLPLPLPDLAMPMHNDYLFTSLAPPPPPSSSSQQHQQQGPSSAQ
ncbi:H/ACA ribonucleoprotein complex non-core subunit naf1 [Balamuthia mandrillaris]